MLGNLAKLGSHRNRVSEAFVNVADADVALLALLKCDALRDFPQSTASPPPPPPQLLCTECIFAVSGAPGCSPVRRSWSWKMLDSEIPCDLE